MNYSRDVGNERQEQINPEVFPKLVRGDQHLHWLLLWVKVKPVQRFHDRETLVLLTVAGGKMKDATYNPHFLALGIVNEWLYPMFIIII